jgi:glycosyltransferase involved in cell wall biosynthesis
MSVYNGEPYLGEAVASILAQTYNDFEFIIIDDGSMDKSAEVIRSYNDVRIQLVQQKNQGIPASVNRGIVLSKGEYIARMDADDISDPLRLERQAQFLDNNPDFIQVGTNAFLIDKDGLLLHSMTMPHEQADIIRELRRGALPFINGSVMYRKIAASQCGYYDEKVVTGQEDWVLCTKMIRFGDMTNLPEILYRHRLTPEGITTMPRRMANLKVNINKKFLATGVLPVEDIARLRVLQKRISPQERRALYYLGAGKALIEGDWQPVRARRYIWQSIRILPWNPVSWINLAFCFLPYGWVSAWKRYRTKG